MNSGSWTEAKKGENPAPPPPDGIGRAAGGILSVRKDRRRWTGTRRIPQDSRWKGQRIHRLPGSPISTPRKRRLQVVDRCTDVYPLFLSCPRLLFSDPTATINNIPLPFSLTYIPSFLRPFFHLFPSGRRGFLFEANGWNEGGSCRLRKTTNFRGEHTRAGENVRIFSACMYIYVPECAFVSCTMAEEDRSRTPADQLWRIPRLGTHRLSDAPSSVWCMDFREEWRHRKLETVNIDNLMHSNISFPFEEYWNTCQPVRWEIIYPRWCNHPVPSFNLPLLTNLTRSPVFRLTGPP